MIHIGNTVNPGLYPPGVQQATLNQYAAAAAAATGGEQGYSSSRATLMGDFLTAQQMQHAQQEV